MSLPAIVRLRNYRSYPAAAPGQEVRVHWLDYSPPKDKVFVAVILGTENKDGSDPLPILDFLRMLEIDGQSVVPEPES